MAIEIVSSVESKERWDGGTLSDIVLIDTVTSVCIEGKGITYLESMDEDGNNLEEGDEGYLQDVYDDWMEMAKSDYAEFAGFSIV